MAHPALVLDQPERQPVRDGGVDGRERHDNDESQDQGFFAQTPHSNSFRGIIPPHLEQRQRHRHLQPSLGPVPGGDASPVLLGDAAGDGEAEAGPGVVGREVGVEDARQEVGGDAGPRVEDGDAREAVALIHPHGHLAAAGAGGAQGVLDQVAHRPLQELGVEAGDDLPGLGREFHGDPRRRRRAVPLHQVGHARHQVGGLGVDPRNGAVGRELRGDRAQLVHLGQDVVGAALEDAIEVVRVVLIDLHHVLGRETDGGERVLDLVGDHAGHLRPGEQALAAQDLGGVLHHQEGRRLARAGQRHPDERPLPLPSPVGRRQPHRGAVHLGTRRAQEVRHRPQPLRAGDRRLQALPHLGAEELGRHPVPHQHPPRAIEGDDAGGDVLHHPLADLLLAHEPLAGVGDLAGHLVDGLHQQGELELGGRQIERGGAGGDAAGPLDELHQRPGEVARQAPPHRDE